MLRDEVTVEVRDRNLERKGTITTKHLSLKATIRHLGVGEWELTLPKDHPMIEHLLTTGSGIIVSLRGETRFSGVTTRPRRDTNLQNPDGTFTFKGVTDDVLLLDALAFPSPAIADPGAQSEANDVQTGNAETLMRHYVSSNVCLGFAPTERTSGFRQFLKVQTTNLNRGVTLTKAPRFQNLMELLYEIAIVADLGFQVIQRDGDLVFEVLSLADRSDLVRLDIKNGTITSESSEVSAPSITRAIVAGSGEGVARVIIERTSASSLQSEDDWGRVIEQFVDQRSTSAVDELQQSGDEKLIAGQLATTAIKIVPSDDQTMIYGADWEVGDTIAVIIDGIEAKTTVTAMTMIVNDKVAAIGAAIGDITEFDADAALVKRVENVETRTANLERAESAGGGGGGGSSTAVSDTAPAINAGFDYWFKSSTGELFFLYTDADSTQWVQLNNGTVADAALTARVTSVESRSTSLESRATSLETRATTLETGVRAVAVGGTGASSLTSGGYLKGNGTSAVTSQTGIPAGDITSGSLAIARGGTGFTVGAGLIPVTPTSIGGATGSISATGRVSITSGTGFYLNGVFTSAFRNYKIIIDHRNMGGAYEYFRFCFSDNNMTTAGAYYGGGFYRQGGSTGIWQNTGDGYSYGSIGYTADGGYTVLDVMSPQWNGSYGKVLAFNSYGAGSHTQVWSDWMWNGWDAFPGIYIYNGGANYSAEVEVYGYNH